MNLIEKLKEASRPSDPTDLTCLQNRKTIRENPTSVGSGLYLCPKYWLDVTVKDCTLCQADPTFKQSLYRKSLDLYKGRMEPCFYLGDENGTAEKECCGGKVKELPVYDCWAKGGTVFRESCSRCSYYASEVFKFRLSVIVTTRDDVEFPSIQNTVRSLVESSPNINLEIIVVDDGSVVPVVSKAPDKSIYENLGIEDCHKSRISVRVIRNEHPIGVAKSRILGYSYSTGDAVAFIDGHEIFRKGSLELMFRYAMSHDVIVCAPSGSTKALESNPKLAFPLTWGGRFHTYHGTGMLQVGFYPEPKEDFSKVDCVIGACYVMSRKTYEKMGGWTKNSGIWGYNEQSFSMKAWFTDTPIVVCRDAWTWHFWKDNSNKDSRLHQPYLIGLEEKNKGAVASTRVIFDDETWKNYWKPALMPECGKELIESMENDPELLKEKEEFQKLKVRKDSNFFSEVLKISMVTDEKRIYSQVSSSREKIIDIIPIGSGYPSSRYRILEYIPCLQMSGWKVNVIERLETYKYNEVSPRIVFVQKRALPNAKLMIETLQQRGSVVIYDLDDTVWQMTPHVQMPALAETIRYADFVLAGNDFLQEQVSRRFNGQAYTLTTPIDPSKYLQAQKRKNEFPDTGQTILGWIGSEGTLQLLEKNYAGFFKVAFKMVPELKLRIIASRPPNVDLGIPIEFRRWSPEKEAEFLLECHIGICPLRESDFAKGKAPCFKILQYMACKLPVIVSPTSIEEGTVLNQKTGYICLDDPVQWANSIFSLQERKRRQEFGEEGFEILKKRYHIDVVFEDLKTVLYGFLKGV